jgi:hypothetical protein
VSGLTPDESVTQPASTGNNSDNRSIIGTWGANASDQSSFRVNNGVMNYITRQYTFNPNGIYSFVSKAFDPLMDKILLGKESGTYQNSRLLKPEDPFTGYRTSCTDFILNSATLPH